MNQQSDYEQRIDSLLEEWNARIDQLEADARHAGPDFRQKYDKEISALILDREATRRGLLRVEESGELCSSCPSESSRKESVPSAEGPSTFEAAVDKILSSDLNVTESPRTTYGKETP